MRTELNAEVDKYIRGLSDNQQVMVTRLLGSLYQLNPNFNNKMRWGQINFTLNGDWHHWICAVYSTKTGVHLNFHKGSLLEDPAGLLEGTGRYSRTLKFQTPDEIDEAMVSYFLHQAIEKQLEL